MKEYERFDRIGTTPHRSYYIPFAQEDVVRTKHSILDRNSPDSASEHKIPFPGNASASSL